MKIGDGPETRQSLTAETSEQRSEKAKEERSYYRHAVQTVSERQATLQWKPTHEREAETPEERETRNGSLAIKHFEQGDEDVTEFLYMQDSTQLLLPPHTGYYSITLLDIAISMHPVKQQHRNKPGSELHN